ncbi:PadR family transcriptional regulator [uncultured Roseibium sp.]|uniref:PadR family transcriptional regulator n=1 Tax=uncultured Roseibium sp. TaxID=1936171 RepID=UPI0032171600
MFDGDHHGRGRRGRGFGRHGEGRGGPGRNGEGRGFRGGRRGQRSGRLFDHGELRIVILALIAEAPRHGYDLIKEIEERTGGAYSPSPGVIYPTLAMLEEMGHATVTESEGKKLYTATEAGITAIAEQQAEADAAFARMDRAAAETPAGPPPQLVRAMENLKLSLRLRLEGGPLSEDQIRTIAAALDTAAVAIEQA